jgi:hypothetical protein
VTRVSAPHAAKVAGITRTSFLRWVRQGRVTRHPDGYELAEVLAAVEARDVEALLIGLGKCKEDRDAILRSVQQNAQVA